MARGLYTKFTAPMPSIWMISEFVMMSILYRFLGHRG
jgi:hypothetical protein